MAFDLRVGDVIAWCNLRLVVTELHGVWHPYHGCMLRVRFSGGGWMKKGYTTLKREFNVIGHV